MKKVLIFLFIGTMFLSVTGMARATILTFDDITTGTLAKIPSHYGGLNWVDDNPNHNQITMGHGAFQDGAVSGGYAAAIGNTTLTVSSSGSGNTFDFLGTYITGGWYTVYSTVEGYLDSRLMYSSTGSAVNGSPTWYQFDYLDINKLVFIGNGDNGDYVIDDFTYNFTSDTNVVPEPATLSLLGLGLVGVIVYRRKLKK